MSSLPQGWHGIPVASQNGIRSSSIPTNHVPITVRKKWNSSLAAEAPRSKLPAYRPSKLHHNPGDSTVLKSGSKSAPVSQSETLTNSTKDVPTTHYKMEIDKLKKELSTLKTENSILKVKVRRVDDENIQKGRQIEKLRVELKTTQKVESSSGSNKSKEYQELLLLRQKCLRLEGALKEKELALKRLHGEACDKLEGTGLCTVLSEAGDVAASDLKSSRKSLTASNSLSRSSHVKTEVAKLREIIHKLEKENQDLQQQVKDKGEEIRSLKMHLRSRTYVKSADASLMSNHKSTAKSATSSVASKVMPTVPNKPKEQKPGDLQKVIKPTNPTKKIEKLPKETSKKADHRSLSKPLPKRSEQRNLEKTTNAKNVKSATKYSTNKPVLRKQLQENKSKLSVTKTQKSIITSKIIPAKSISNSTENHIEDEAQRLRENIAAKKIQRSWRKHQKQNIERSEMPRKVTNGNNASEKAIAFIASSLKHHKMRKGRLNLMQKQKRFSPPLIPVEGHLMEAIQQVTNTLWHRDHCETGKNA